MSLAAALERDLARFGARVESGAAQRLIQARRDDTGVTRQSLFFDTDRTASGVSVRIGAANRYAPFVHDGRGPGKRPPIAVIRPWVERKLGVPRDESRSVAFLVARKIGERGTKGTPFLKDAFDAELPALLPALAATAERYAADLVTSTA